MRKILELAEKEFMSGIAPSSQVQNKGLWHKAKGITVFRDLFQESENIGLLQAAPAPTDITGSVIRNIPFAWETDVSDTSSKTLYIWDRGASLYSIDLASDSAPTELTAGAMTNGANGLFLMKHSTGVKRLWYFRTDGIGYYGNIGAGPSFNNSVYTTDIQTTEYHQTHRLFDRIYFCNGNYIGYCVDNGAAGLTVTPTALDFEPIERVNCINDDGTYLVAGVTMNKNTDSLTRGETRIIFWDQYSSSWQREWPIPDASILSIQRVGSHMEAVTTRGVFAFTFNTAPQQLIPFTSTDHVPDYQYAAQFATDVLGESLFFGGSTRVSSFGKPAPHIPAAFFQPFGGFTGTVSLVVSSAKTNDLIVGTTSSKLYRVKLNGAPTTGMVAETIYIDLDRWYQVAKIVLGFDGQLASGDEVNVDVQPDDATSASDWGTASYASHGAIRSKELYGSKEARKLKLIINFNGGTPRIRQVEVWGDPIERPIHSRV